MKKRLQISMLGLILLLSFNLKTFAVTITFSEIPDICSGEEIDLDEYVSPSGGSWSYYYYETVLLDDGVFLQGVSSTTDITLYYSYTALGVTTTETTTITVHVEPEFDLDYEHDLSICEGSTTEYNLFSSTYFYPMDIDCEGTRTWNFIIAGDTTEGTVFTAEGIDPGTYSVYLMLTSGYGCSYSEKSSKSLTIKDAPEFNVSNISNIEPCEYSTDEYGLSGYISGVSPSTTTFTYSGASVTESTFCAELLESDTYKIYATGKANGCSVTKTAEIEVQPTPSFDFASSEITPCEGSSEQFNLNEYISNLSPSGSSISYSGSGVSGDTVFSAADLSGGTFAVSINATSPKGCSVTEAASITVMTAPVTPTISGDIQSLCKGDTLMIVLTNGSSSDYSVSWTSVDGDDFGSSLSYTLSNLVEDQTLYVTYTGTNGCETTKTLEATVDPIQAVFSFEDTIVAKNAEVQFTSSSVNASKWEWDFDEGNVISEENPVVTFSNAGYHDVSLVVTSVNGCSDTTSVESAIFVSSESESASISDDKKMTDVAIYPQPMQDKLTVVNTESGKAVLSIISITGAIISQQDIYPGENIIDVSSLNEGAYIVNVSGDGYNSTKKIIKIDSRY